MGKLSRTEKTVVTHTRSMLICKIFIIEHLNTIKALEKYANQSILTWLQYRNRT